MKLISRTEFDELIDYLAGGVVIECRKRGLHLRDDESLGIADDLRDRLDDLVDWDRIDNDVGGM